MSADLRKGLEVGMETFLKCVTSHKLSACTHTNIAHGGMMGLTDIQEREQTSGFRKINDL